jgi:hypothetical protein
MMGVEGVEMDVLVTVDDELPTHAIFLTDTRDEKELNVTVSPEIELKVISLLQPNLALVVAGAVEADRAQQASRGSDA